MQSSVRLGTNDLERAKKFYDEIAAILGASRVTERENLICYKGPEGGMLIVGTAAQGEATVGNGSQVSLPAASRSVVDALHAKAVELGGKDEGKPGVRGPDPNGMYAAYFRDLDGNKLMAVKFGPP